MMNLKNSSTGLLLTGAILFLMALGCGGTQSGPKPEWTKLKKIAGKEQGLSHVSGVVVDDKFAYTTIGGTVADANAGTNGLRKVPLDGGAVTMLDNGEKYPQAEQGGIAQDEKYVYWNSGGEIARIGKDNGKREAVATEFVGIGIDMVLDTERVYWANHGYYSSSTPIKPSPIYSVAKSGGKAEIFVDGQMAPGNIVVDEKFVYWTTPSSIMKQAKTGGTPQVVLQASDKEGIDKLEQDGGDLYFGFRGAGESRWALRKISKAGGEPQTIAKTFSLKQFVIDDENIYFFDEEGLSADVLCRVPKSGGEVTKLDTGYASGVMTGGKTKVFLASLDDIYAWGK
ncbi:MAG: hypothetical protein IPI64_06610 [Chloracidobacterium sp.]|nr:hypothetical protein [Chloracidobacterium sp.]